MNRLCLFLALVTAHAALWAEEYIVLQSTTSTHNSGLLDYLVPIFRDATQIDVRTVAVGTGQ